MEEKYESSSSEHENGHVKKTSIEHEDEKEVFNSIPIEDKKKFESLIDMSLELLKKFTDMKTLVLDKADRWEKKSRRVTPYLKKIAGILDISINHCMEAEGHAKELKIEVRGGWNTFYNIIDRNLHYILRHVRSLPDDPYTEAWIGRIEIKGKMERFLTGVVEHVVNLEGINQLFPLAIRASVDGMNMNDEHIEEVTGKFDVPPFWYTYDMGLSLLKTVIETLKIALAGAITSDVFVSQVAIGSFHGLKSILAAETDRFKRVNSLTREKSIKLLEALWNFPTNPMICKALMITYPSINVCRTIWVPRSIAEGGPIRCKLLYHSKDLPLRIPKETKRDSNDEYKFEAPTPKFPPVPVILHFHGGGFISGNPEVHESYLRMWALNTNSLIISVDYTLAPAKQYPVAVNECYYVYKWLMKDNPWGLNPKPIVVTGDSAGGNLAITTAFKAIMENLPIPTGLLLSYPALDLTKTVTASRMLFINDVLVPYYSMIVCRQAYIAEGEDLRNPLISPLYAPDELLLKLPHIAILSAGLDPLLDDSIRLINRLEKLNKVVEFNVYELLPHGFLNFGHAIKAAEDATKKSLELLNKLLSIQEPHTEPTAPPEPESTVPHQVPQPSSQPIPNLL